MSFSYLCSHRVDNINSNNINIFYRYANLKFTNKGPASAVARGTVIWVVCCLKGKCFFQPLGLEKPMNILKPNLAGVIMSVRSTNSPHLVKVGCEMAPARGGEI